MKKKRQQQEERMVKVSLLRQLENGFYQFCVDHAKSAGNDVWNVRFGMTTKRDLLRRVYARGTGMYQIKDEAQMEREADKAHQEYESLKLHNIKRLSFEKKVYKLPKWKLWVILTLRRTAGALATKWVRGKYEDNIRHR